MFRTSSTCNTVLMLGLAIASAGVVVRAASLSSAYQAEVQRLQREWQAAQQTEGLSGSAQRKALYAKYPTPELKLAKPVALAPGASAPLAVAGTFSPQTVFLLENDQVSLSQPTAAAGRFSATVSAAPDALPGFARLYAYTPVSGAWTTAPAVFVGTPPTFALTASNGWAVALVPQASSFTLDGAEASVRYKAEFRRAGESAVFETASGTLTLDGTRGPTDQWSMSITAGEAGSAMEEMLAIQAQMGDMNAYMKMTEKQRDALSAKLEALGERMTKEAEATMADPTAAQRKQDAFGCQYVSLTLAGSSVTGHVSCGKDVGSLQVTGTRR